jgi:protein-L-isoaspartate O-methyltransferase
LIETHAWRHSKIRGSNFFASHPEADYHGESIEVTDMADATPRNSAQDSSRTFTRLARLFTPNRHNALRQYRSRAPIYDLELALLTPVRERAIEMLGLKRGDHVLDVGCGTGLSFTLLEGLVGAEGSITGIEQSP